MSNITTYQDFIKENIENYIKAYNNNFISSSQLEQRVSECATIYNVPENRQYASGGSIYQYVYGERVYKPVTITTDGTFYPGGYTYYPTYPTTTTGDNYWIYTTGNGNFDVLNNEEMENIKNLPEEIKMKITKDVEKAIKDKIKIEFDSQLKSMRETMNDLNMSIVNETTAINILKQEKVLLEKQINEFKEQLSKTLKDIEETSEKYAKRVMRFQLLDIEENE